MPAVTRRDGVLLVLGTWAALGYWAAMFKWPVLLGIGLLIFLFLGMLYCALFVWPYEDEP